MIATMLMAASLSFDFAAGQWDRAQFFEARNDDRNEGAPIVQQSDCIMNYSDPSWSDEELFKSHQPEVFSSLILTNRFRGTVSFSSRMSFDHRMAPALVVAGDFARDAQGRTAFRELYEIVLFEDGINVWHHQRPNGGKSVIDLVAYFRRPFKPRTVYELAAKVRPCRGYRGVPTTDFEITIDGATFGFRDKTAPGEYSVGLIGSEGRCRFYDFKVEEQEK